MKYIRYWSITLFIVSFSSSTYADYSNSLNFSLSNDKLEFNIGPTIFTEKTTTEGHGFIHYFTPINTEIGPLQESEFLYPSSGIFFTRTLTDTSYNDSAFIESESRSIGLGGIFVTPRKRFSLLLFKGTKKTSYDVFIEDDEVKTTFINTIFKIVDNHGINIFIKADDPDDSFDLERLTTLSFGYKGVSFLGGNRFISFSTGLTKRFINYVETSTSEDFIITDIKAGFAYFFSRYSSLGIERTRSTDNQDSGASANNTRIAFNQYFNEVVALEVNYNLYTFDSEFVEKHESKELGFAFTFQF